MNVLHPTLLAAGLAAIGVPILIHLLLRRRYRHVQWAAMRFVQVAQKQQRRRRRLEQILLLVARCLLLALIAFAVARPFFGDDTGSGEKTLVLVLDDGITASAVGDDGRAELAGHLEAALEQIGELDFQAGDRVAVFGAASLAPGIVPVPTSDFNAARAAIEAITPTDSVPNFPAALQLARDAAAGTGVRSEIVVVSGWRAGSLAPAGDRASAGADSGKAGSDADGTGSAVLPSAANAGVDQDSDLAISGLSGAMSADLVLTDPATDTRPNLRITRVEVPRLTLLGDDDASARRALITIDRVGTSAESNAGSAGARLAGEVTVSLVSSTGETVSLGRTVGFAFAEGERETRVAVDIPPEPTTRGLSPRAYALVTALSAPAGTDSIGSDSTVRTALRFATGVNAGVVRARGVSTDDAAIRPSAWLNAALRPTESTPIRLRELAPSGIDEDALIGLDLLAIARPDLLTARSWTSLGEFSRLGGCVVLFAPDIDGVHAWVDDAVASLPELEGLSREAQSLSSSRSVTPGLGAAALPVLNTEMERLASSVRVHRLLGMNADPGSVVLSTDAGEPLLTRAGPQTWVFTTALSPEWSNLPARPLFVPLMQEIARQCPEQIVARTLTAGLDARSPDGLASTDGVSMSRGLIASVRSSRDDSGQSTGLEATNADVRGGDTATLTRERVEAALNEGGTLEIRWSNADGNGNDAAPIAGTKLGLMIFAAALLVALFESLIALRSVRPRAAARLGAAS